MTNNIAARVRVRVDSPYDLTIFTNVDGDIQVTTLKSTHPLYVPTGNLWLDVDQQQQAAEAITKELVK